MTMNYPSIFIFLVFVLLPFLILCQENDRPIIGVLAEETYSKSKFRVNGTSFITASYVKFLEAGGARVVPIMIHQPKEYYEDILGKINGVLFPGGANVMESDGFGRSGRIIFDIALKLNERKDYFPLWGTCLGFEFLNFLVAKKLWMKACKAEDVASPINFTPDYYNSRMFADAEKDVLRIMSSENITINYHQWCLTAQNYTLSGLDKFFKVLSYSQDAKNATYISAIEAYQYPFYGVAFHPEKVLFEWASSKSHHNIPHTHNAVRVAQFFANFFVSEARKSKHKFSNRNREDELLIYNYTPLFTGKFNSSIVQNYYFNETQL